MSTKIKIMMPCDKANHVCNKAQYKEASFCDKIKLTIHLIYCKACRKYSKKNAKLSETINKSKVECMDRVAKETLKENFEKVLNEH